MKRILILVVVGVAVFLVGCSAGMAQPQPENMKGYNQEEILMFIRNDLVMVNAGSQGYVFFFEDYPTLRTWDNDKIRIRFDPSLGNPIVKSEGAVLVNSDSVSSYFKGWVVVYFRDREQMKEFWLVITNTYQPPRGGGT